MKISSATLGVNFTEAFQLTSADRRAMLDKAKALGTTAARVEVPWGLVEKSKGKYDFSVTDQMFSDLKLAGFSDVLVVFAHGPGQTAPGKGLAYSGWWFSSAVTPIDFAYFCSAFAMRYPWVRNYEIFNEQNTSVNWPGANAKTWTPYLIAAYQALKTPQRTIALGGLAACVTYDRSPFFWLPEVHTRSPLDYLAAVHQAGGRDFYDVVSYHPYPLLDDYSTAVAPTANQKFVAMPFLLHGLSQRPVWCTEYGFDISWFSPDQQAEHITDETNILAGMEGVERLYVYSLRDNNGFKFGLYDNMSLPRPAAKAFVKLFP